MGSLGAPVLAWRYQVLRLWQTRFGPLPAEVTARVRRTDTETLLRWSERILQAPTLDAVCMAYATLAGAAQVSGTSLAGCRWRGSGRRELQRGVRLPGVEVGWTPRRQAQNPSSLRARLVPTPVHTVCHPLPWLWNCASTQGAGALGGGAVPTTPHSPRTLGCSSVP